MNYLVRNAKDKIPKYLKVLKENVNAEIRTREVRPRKRGKSTWFLDHKYNPYRCEINPVGMFSDACAVYTKIMQSIVGGPNV